MDNKKDTQKTSLNSYGQTNAHSQNSLPDKPIYEFVNKKTEKLVTALYMVTDCMETDDAMKSKLRLLGVELLSDIHSLSTSPLLEKSLLVSGSLARINEILSFVEIAYTIGYISDMNTMILKKEFALLLGELQSYKSKDKHFTFTLDEQMFNLSDHERRGGDSYPEKNLQSPMSFIKDKRTSDNNMSFINRSQYSYPERQSFKSNSESNVSDKEDRKDKILALIKDKNSLSSNKDFGVSIKDISSAFMDCSEKTIQREINSLVSKGKLKKTGAKRWSRYQVV